LSKYATDLLRKIGFSEQAMRKALPGLTIRSYDVGELVWPKGCAVRSWNCVMSGYVGACMSRAQGLRRPLHVYGPQTWFGESALLGMQPSHLDYQCLTPVELVCMSLSCLQEAIREQPGFVRFLLALMAFRAQQHTDMLMWMRRGSMSLRVVMGLAQFAQGQPHHSAEPAPAQHSEVQEIAITQDQIAAFCGVSRTVFSTCLQPLVRAGWVKVRYGAISLQWAGAWRVVAHQHRACEHIIERPGMDAWLAALSRARETLSPATPP
jgi:CRP-like cAMP-binding protein